MRRAVETPQHQAACNEMLSRFLPAQGVTTTLREIAGLTEVPLRSLVKWVTRETSLPSKYHPAINAWIEQRAKVSA